ncbi:MAG: hypothetical protein IJR50_01125, partial [Treponema sp.]|nr:hypothetical protein [Treponema sp.]
MMRRYISLAIALCCFSFCWGAEISFQVVQHDDAVSEVREQTLIIEDAILEYFFNNGDIVTNEPAVAATEKEADKIIKIALSYAADGGAQYFVQLRLFYDESTPSDLTHVSLANLKRVSWAVADVATRKEITEGKSKVPRAVSGKANADGVKEYAASIAA